MKKSILSALKVSLLAAALSLVFSNSYAVETDNLTVGVGEEINVRTPSPSNSVVVGNRSVAKVIKHNNSSFSIVGKSVGATNVSFSKGKKIIKKIRVNVGGESAKFSGIVDEGVNTAISGKNLTSVKKSIKTFFPNEQIGVSTVNDTVVLSGTASDAETAAQAVKIAEQFTGKNKKVLNLMKIRTGQQVMLRVRVGEIDRDELKKLGLGLHGIISAGSAVFGALERDGTLKILAEPTLTAISGQSAKFLAGGEFPVPVAQAGNVMSVDYKSFGVGVNFTPLVLSEDRIRLDVASEVSELSDNGAVNTASMKIPAIATRRANTVVELAPGESFMIAGLINDKSKADIHKVPGLGDIPILSPLFRSAKFQRNQSELVIAVTPYLVDPASGEEVKLPTDNYKEGSILQMLFLGKAGYYTDPDPKKGLEGSAGYLTD